MVETAGLSVKILGEIDQGSLAKALAKAKKDMEKALGSANVNVDVSGGKGGSGADSSGMLKILGSMMAKLAIVASITAGLYAVFRPVIKIVQIIGRLLAEFLRPISDVITILLMPLLMILKPILKTFQALMMPYKKLAMQGLAAAQSLIGRGMKAGTDTSAGADLLGEGIKTALASAGLLMLPLIDLVTTPLRNIMDLVLAGIQKLAVTIVGFFSTDAAASIDQFFDNTRTKLTGGINESGSMLNGLKTSFEGLIGDGIDLNNKLNDMSKVMGEDNLIKTLQGAEEGFIDTIKAMNPEQFDELVTNINNIITSGGIGIENSVSDIVNKVQAEINGLIVPKGEEEKFFEDTGIIRDTFREIASLGKTVTGTYNKGRHGQLVGEKKGKAISSAMEKSGYSTSEWTPTRIENANDFVLQPGGKLIKTSPSDTITGTKNGGAGGTNITNNISINASISSDMDIKNLANKISLQIQQNLARRIS